VKQFAVGTILALVALSRIARWLKPRPVQDGIAEIEKNLKKSKDMKVRYDAIRAGKKQL